MKENVISDKLMVEIEKVIQNYIDVAKEHNRKPTKDEIIEEMAIKLEERLKNSENKERVWILSGIAIGITISLRIEDMLNVLEADE